MSSKGMGAIIRLACGDIPIRAHGALLQGVAFSAFAAMTLARINLLQLNRPQTTQT